MNPAGLTISVPRDSVRLLPRGSRGLTLLPRCMMLHHPLPVELLTSDRGELSIELAKILCIHPRSERIYLAAVLIGIHFRFHIYYVYRSVPQSRTIFERVFCSTKS